MIPPMIRVSLTSRQKVRPFDSPKTSSAALFQPLIRGLPGDLEPLGSEGGKPKKNQECFFRVGRGSCLPDSE